MLESNGVVGGCGLACVYRPGGGMGRYCGQESTEGLDPVNGTPWFHRPALMGFPRHLSQHVGGFVITRGRLDELVPIENAAMQNRTVIEWDKDDLAALVWSTFSLLAC